MTLRWGFLGAGSIARSSVGPAIRRAPGHTLHAVASTDPGRAAALGPARVHPDYARLLADPEVDAVYVCLHNQAHLHWVRMALRHGKDVLCEKPLGLTAAEVQAMTVEASAARRLLVEAAWNRWHPRTRAAEDLLAAGVLGRVRRVVAHFRGASPAADNYRRNAALGGGALWDVGCYAIAGALSAVGWRAPTAVTATRTCWDGSAADVATRARLVFDDTATVDLVATLDGHDEQLLEVYGDHGTLRLSRPAFTAGAAPSTMHLLVEGSAPRELHYPATDPYQLMVEAFGAAIRGETPWLLPLAQSAAVAAVIDTLRSVGGTSGAGVPAGATHPARP